MATRFVLAATARACGHEGNDGDRAGGLADPHRARVERAQFFRARSASKEDSQGPCPLPPCASHRSSWFGHAPGVEQFGETLFRKDFLFFGYLAHGLA